MATPIFRVHDLSKVYGEGAAAVHAVRGVTLDVDEGRLLVLPGPSGSGKSTILNILGGPEYDDDVLTEYRRSSLGFVFQFSILIASLTACENVSLITQISESRRHRAGSFARRGCGRATRAFVAADPSMPRAATTADDSG